MDRFVRSDIKRCSNRRYNYRVAQKFDEWLNICLFFQSLVDSRQSIVKSKREAISFQLERSGTDGRISKWGRGVRVVLETRPAEPKPSLTEAAGMSAFSALFHSAARL